MESSSDVKLHPSLNQSLIDWYFHQDELTDTDRYSMLIGDMGQQEEDLLECLQRIDRGEPLDERADALLGRLVRAGLVDSTDGVLTLTNGGISRCQSLQHRQAGDRASAQVLIDRAQSPEQDSDT